jgi:hypothetical protein
MAHRIQRLPSALPWTFKQADRRERQSDHVLNTPETRQSQAAVSSDAGSQASQQVLHGHDSQIMIAGLAAEVRPVLQQLAAKEESAGDDEHLHQSGATQKICSELVSEALLNLDSTQEVLSSTPLLDLGLTFRLNSRPSATKVIYLDFNGHTTSGTSWNNSTMGSSFYSPAYDTNGDPASFSDSELISIQQIWQRVANDFSAFDVNVTLQEPPADWLARAGSGDENWGVRAVISSYGPSSSTAAGIAFVGSFNSSTDTPVFIYNKTLVGVSETISHEVGHALGLSHDGTASTTYYTGHGGTGETSWAPIMGGSYNRNVTTWDDGTYAGSNNTGSTANYGKGDDDLAVIVGGNGFSYRPDLVGNSASAAAPLSIMGEAVGQFGTIETRYDVDYYSFEILDIGNLDLSFSPYWYRAYVDEDGVWGGSHAAYLASTSDVRSTTPYPDNAASLDLEVQLYDRYSNLLYTSNDPGLATSISLQGLSTGTYFLKLDGVGFGDPTASTPTGYTDYASIGDYWISGTITSAAGVSTPPVITLSLSPSLVKEDGSANLLYTFTRSQASAQSLSVNFTVSGTATNGSDFQIQARRDGDEVMLEVFGVSAHSSEPESGINPVSRLLAFMHSLSAESVFKTNQFTDAARYATENWGLEHYGESMGIAYRHDFMGPLTVAQTFVATDTDGLRTAVNLRLPVGREPEALLQQIDSRLTAWKAATGVDVLLELSAGAPMYRNPEGAWVNALLDIAVANLDIPREFGSSAGATSIHDLPNGVQFGLAMPTEKYTGHNANEFKRLEQFLTDLQIVTEMFARLGTMENL